MRPQGSLEPGASVIGSLFHPQQKFQCASLPIRKADCWVAQLLCMCACLHMAWHSNSKSVRHSSCSAVKSLLPHEMVLLQSLSVLCSAGQQCCASFRV